VPRKHLSQLIWEHLFLAGFIIFEKGIDSAFLRLMSKMKTFQSSKQQAASYLKVNLQIPLKP
jgi:hypothetical protein